MNLAYFALIPAFAILDRWCGGGMGWRSTFRGRPIYYILPLIPVAWLIDWRLGVILTGWIIWREPKWALFGGSLAPKGREEILGTFYRHLLILPVALAAWGLPLILLVLWAMIATKADAIEAFIAKTYGDTFAKAFAGRMNALKAKLPLKTSGTLVQATTQGTQTRPQDEDTSNLMDFRPMESPEGEEEPSEPEAGVAGTSIGMRNNNAGNLRDGKFTQSQSGYVGADKNGFAIFETPQDGERAQELLLKNSYLAKGHDTIEEIIERYNPRADPRNTPEVMKNYKAFVADRLGIGINDKIDVSMLGVLAEAQRAFETGDR